MLRLPTRHLPSSLKTLSTSARPQKWTGRQSSEHVLNEDDKHNVQHDASREGKAERASGKEEGGRATSESSGGSNERAKEEFPESPDTIGMQDERGGPIK